MLIEGLKLLTIGMGIVFIFLLLMYLSIYIQGIFLQEKSLAEYNASIARKKGEIHLIPVITAAVSAFRRDRERQVKK